MGLIPVTVSHMSRAGRSAGQDIQDGHETREAPAPLRCNVQNLRSSRAAYKDLNLVLRASRTSVRAIHRDSPDETTGWEVGTPSRPSVSNHIMSTKIVNTYPLFARIGEWFGVSKTIDVFLAEGKGVGFEAGSLGDDFK